MIARFLRLDYLDQFITILILAVGLALTVIVAGEARRMWKKRKPKKSDPLTDVPDAQRN